MGRGAAGRAALRRMILWIGIAAGGDHVKNIPCLSPPITGPAVFGDWLLAGGDWSIDCDDRNRIKTKNTILKNKIAFPD